MWFDPGDNLFGEPIFVWLVVALIWLGPIFGFWVWGQVIDRRGRREWQAELAEKQARNDPPT